MCRYDSLRGSHLCAHKPVCIPHFLRSSAWSQRARVIPCSDIAHRCDGADVLRYGGLFHALSLLYVGARGLEDAVHLGPQADVFRNGAPGALILHLAQHLLVHRAVQRVVFLEVRRRRDLDAWPYPCTHPPSGSRGAGCQCLCRVASSAHHIPP